MYYFFFSSRRRHTRYWRDWSSDVCSSDLTCRPWCSSLGRLPVVVPDGGAVQPLTRPSADRYLVVTWCSDAPDVVELPDSLLTCRFTHRAFGPQWLFVLVSAAIRGSAGDAVRRTCPTLAQRTGRTYRSGRP